MTERAKLDASSKEAMKKRAIENGLLEKAQKNAENQITRLLVCDPAIGDTYKIQFVAAEK